MSSCRVEDEHGDRLSDSSCVCWLAVYLASEEGLAAAARWMAAGEAGGTEDEEEEQEEGGAGPNDGVVSEGQQDDDSYSLTGEDEEGGEDDEEEQQGEAYGQPAEGGAAVVGGACEATELELQGRDAGAAKKGVEEQGAGVEEDGGQGRGGEGRGGEVGHGASAVGGLGGGLDEEEAALLKQLEEAVDGNELPGFDEWEDEAGVEESQGVLELRAQLRQLERGGVGQEAVEEREEEEVSRVTMSEALGPEDNDDDEEEAEPGTSALADYAIMQSSTFADP